MLINLSVANILLIDNLDLDLKEGFTVITGETGAGKSIIINCLKCLQGIKMPQSMIKPGAKQAIICASFEVDSNIREFLGKLSIEADVELLVKRVIKENGIAKNYLNDMPVSLSSLKDITSQLLEIHGQASQYKDFSSSAHMQVLDKFANNEAILEELKNIYSDLLQSQQKLKALLANEAEIGKEKELLQFAVEELEKLDIKNDEFNELTEKKAILSEKSKVHKIISEILQEFERKELSQYLFQVQKTLVYNANLFSRYKEYDSIIKSNEFAIDKIYDFKEKLEALFSKGFSEESLDKVTERLLDIKDVCNKYDILPEETLSFIENKKQRLLEIESKSQDTAALSTRIESLEKQYFEKACKLSLDRKKAAIQLERKVLQELFLVSLNKARFKITVDYNEQSAKSLNGLDKVLFTVSANPGTDLHPIHQSASGGELSRLMLAVKVAISKDEVKKTFIFDEVDTGIGGAVADSVGNRLKILGKNNQVISVTHHPQVASQADSHVLIKKTHLERDTITEISYLSSRQKLEELARMLSGKDITKESRIAAQKLLEG